MTSTQRFYSYSLANSTLVSTSHHRERCEERNIAKVLCQKARRMGLSEPLENGRVGYTFGGTYYVHDAETNRAITCYPTKDKCGTKSGSKFVDPVMVMKDTEHVTEQYLRSHEDFDALSKKERWTNHHILVVDMSGSMRTDDVNGARCRSDGVWTCLARDFVKAHLDKEKNWFDIVSVVLMGKRAKVAIRHEPMTWALYNKLVAMKEWSKFRPEGHGNYLPALTQVQKLLQLNTLGSVGLSVFFCSDGKPSDAGATSNIVKTVGEIASQFGRRLTFGCVGLADRDEDFSVLIKMANEAAAYGANGWFDHPSCTSSFDVDSLSRIISYHVSTLALTKRELSQTVRGKTAPGKSVRIDILRERGDTPDDHVPSIDWRVFRASNSSQYTKHVWKWNTRDGDFCRVLDRRCHSCFSLVADQAWETGTRGEICNGCKATYLCSGCIADGMWRGHRKEDCCAMLEERRKGAVQKKDIISYNVAWKRACFGEGAERVAYKFRFLNDDDNFIGPVMVAKESRFVHDRPDEHNRRDHIQFMTAQVFASRCADKFNEYFDNLAARNAADVQQRVHAFPRICFLEPLIFELVDDSKTYNVLVEPFIDGEYTKYNGNYGDLFEATSAEDGVNKAAMASKVGRKTNMGGKIAPLLAAVAEESDDEISQSEEESSQNDDSWGKAFVQDANLTQFFSCEGTDYFAHLVDGQHVCAAPIMTDEVIPDGDFAQAFSHFSYLKSNRQSIVVDLQGSLKIHSDGRREFIFTDPAVHTRKKNLFLQNLKFGRTDLGEKGMKAFFATHVCNNACRALGLPPETSFPSPQTKANPFLTDSQRKKR
ncbi:hypothetical protein MPSEU_000228600 [Mayamaea pseudoterrestris]|nr:hypothetical protein MPSEU_000228600 [Mayamaea pseudoterrestris]